MTPNGVDFSFLFLGTLCIYVAQQHAHSQKARTREHDGRSELILLATFSHFMLLIFDNTRQAVILFSDKCDAADAAMPYVSLEVLNYCIELSLHTINLHTTVS